MRIEVLGAATRMVSNEAELRHDLPERLEHSGLKPTDEITPAVSGGESR